MQTDKLNEYKKGLSLWYYQNTGNWIDFDKPKNFNEKLQWLKLFDNKPIKTLLADKYLVRDWIRKKIGNEYLIPLIGVYDKFEDIDFSRLPKQFVMKCNHGSGWNIIVKDKNLLDLNEAKNKINFWMSSTFGLDKYELHYQMIKPKIVIEEFISQNETDSLQDYKLFCFNGVPEFVQVIFDRKEKHAYKTVFYDKNWKKQDWIYVSNLKCAKANKSIAKPKELDLLLDLAKKLSSDFPFVRCDFYSLDDGRIYFGEMTFFPTSGRGLFEPSYPHILTKYLSSVPY